MHIICSKGHVDGTVTLLKLGASVNVLNKVRFTLSIIESLLNAFLPVAIDVPDSFVSGSSE